VSGEPVIYVRDFKITWFISERPTQASAPRNTSAAPTQR
jgi:hypothetical protein